MPIFIGLRNEEKLEQITSYRDRHGISHVVHFRGYGDLTIPGAECITAKDLDAYSEFYRLIREIGSGTLVVVDEFLTNQYRFSTQYNTLRHFLKQTDHQLVFNYVPQIDENSDFMILFDLDTKGKWIDRKFDLDLVHRYSSITCIDRTPIFEFIQLAPNEHQSRRYAERKEQLFQTIGLKDPHIIPRQLYMMSLFYKVNYIRFMKPHDDLYISRLWSKHKNIFSYNEVQPDTPYIIIQFQHRFIDMIRFFQVSRQKHYKVFVADTKADQWYKERYSKWRNRLEETCQGLQQQ